MLALGLDLSTHIGWAVIKDKKLFGHGTIDIEVKKIEEELSDYEMLRIAISASEVVSELVKNNNPDIIGIEQTNRGKNRGSQKQLEFIHCCTLQILDKNGLKDKIFYVDTSAWRSKLGIKLSKDQRDHNKLLKEKKKALKAQGKKLTSKKGEGKITWKHLSVNWVNNKFNLKLKQKDNDAADAICIAAYGSENIKKVQKHNIDDVMKTWQNT